MTRFNNPESFAVLASSLIATGRRVAIDISNFSFLSGLKTLKNYRKQKSADHAVNKYSHAALIALFVVLVYSSFAHAQKACSPVTATTQSCTVTITWNAPSTGTKPTSYLVQRQDGTGAMIDIKTVATLGITDTVIDSGNTPHNYQVLSLAGKDRSGPSNVAGWITPAIVAVPPPFPQVPPLANITEVWTLGKPHPDLPGNREILKDGVSVGGAYGSRIAKCKEVVWVFGRNLTWYRYTGAWNYTGLKTLAC